MAFFGSIGGVPKLLGINATYTQSGNVYADMSLEDLKLDLVVTATYQGSIIIPISNYTLSGTLTVGTSTITVNYKGYTTTFDVTVSIANDSYEWDFTQSLTDLNHGEVAVLSHASLVTGVGVKDDSDSTWGSLTIFPSYDYNFEGKTVEIDFKSLIMLQDSDTHGLLSVCHRNGSYDDIYSPFYYRPPFTASLRNQLQSYTTSSRVSTFTDSTFKFVFTSNHMVVTVNNELFYDGGTIIDGYSNLQIGDHWGSFIITGIRIYENE